MPGCDIMASVPCGNPDLSEAQRLYEVVQLRMAQRRGTGTGRPDAAAARRLEEAQRYQAELASYRSLQVAADAQRRQDESARQNAQDAIRKRVAQPGAAEALKRMRTLDEQDEEDDKPLRQRVTVERGYPGLFLHDTIDYLTGRRIPPPVQWVSLKPCSSVLSMRPVLTAN